MVDDLSDKTAAAELLGQPAPVESISLAQAMARLSPKKARFVAELVSGVPGAEAARRAGWATLGAATRAWKLTHKDADVMAAIDAARGELQKKAEYGLDKAMVELNAAIAFATKTENATAYVRAVELKSKLMGLLVERQDVRNLSSFSIRMSGIDDVIARG